MTLFKTWNVKFRHWTFTEIQSGTSLHLAGPAASQHNGAFVLSDQIQVSFLKVSAPTSVCTKIPIVGWGWQTVCWTFWRTTTMKMCRQQPGWPSCLGLKAEVARRQSETFFSSSRCLRWEDVLLCSICFFNVVYLLFPSVCKGPYELFLQPTSRRH